MATLRPFLALIGLFVMASTASASPDCADAGLLGESFLEAYCFECLFPLRIATIPSAPGPLPPNATASTICSCDGESIGVTVGSWHPVRLIEVVTTPGCSPLLGGITVIPGVEGFRGTVGSGEPLGHGHAFFHVHSYPFPFAALLDPFGNTPCRSQNDSAPPYFTELDPGWNLEGLSWLDSPEILFTANPLAIATCALDSATANLGEPNDALFWCAGSWGLLEPFNGRMRSSLGTDPALTSLAGVRHQGLLHRRGLGLQTTGDAALCGGVPTPFLQKSQYRMSRIYPRPELTGNHAIGADPHLWSAAPPNWVPGQPSVFILWRWEDCCLPVI